MKLSQTQLIENQVLKSMIHEMLQSTGEMERDYKNLDLDEKTKNLAKANYDAHQNIVLKLMKNLNQGEI